MSRPFRHSELCRTEQPANRPRHERQLLRIKGAAQCLCRRDFGDVHIMNDSPQQVCMCAALKYVPEGTFALLQSKLGYGKLVCSSREHTCMTHPPVALFSGATANQRQLSQAVALLDSKLRTSSPAWLNMSTTGTMTCTPVPPSLSAVANVRECTSAHAHLHTSQMPVVLGN
jgi:hypothetical protein